MVESIDGFSVHAGVIATEDTPGSEALYVTTEQLQALTGLSCGEEPLRFAQSLIDAYCQRRSLWPCIYEQDLTLPEDRQQARLAITPVIRLLEVNGRYALGRRSTARRQGGALDWYVVASVSGSPPQWSTIDVGSIDLFPATGQFWVPSGTFLPFTHLRVRYLAGFPQIPHRVKMAMATIVHNIQERGLSERIRHQVGRVVSQYKDNSFIPSEAKMLLEPYVVQSLT